jgi:regulator of replication initiation timing
VLADVENAASKVFVFGKKVDDFHVVDYDQLFSMNIGATQQLAIENQKLMKDNAALQAENEAIKKRLAALERAVANLQKHK